MEEDFEDGRDLEDVDETLEGLDDFDFDFGACRSRKRRQTSSFW